ncbi:MAG: GTP-binding protein, partial [Melioribacteraceae bacterium]|nr:GTP-binding protein [Melioribacteraceae bacterium]
MKEFSPEQIRNICFIGHGGSGKTTISEYLLYAAGEINRLGSIEEGNTTSDFNPNETERQISISAAPLHIEWKNSKVNFIDTPGYSDFVGQVIAGLHVADTAVEVVKSAEGVEVGTETTWNHAAKNEMPSAIIINKIDNEHSKFEETFEIVKDRLSNDATIISYPVTEGPSFNTIIDVVKMKALSCTNPSDKKIVEMEIPAEEKEKADALHEELVEKIAESDEDLMNKFFEEGTLKEEDLKKGMRAAILNRSLIPVFAVSAKNGIGMQNFMDFTINFLPSPLDRGPADATKLNDNENVKVVCDPTGNPSLLVFKSLSEQHVGELSIFKVYSGALEAGMDMLNTTREKTERLGQLFFLNGKNRKDVSKVTAGDIGAVVKLKDTHTGNTLASKENPIILKQIEFPESVIRGAIKPKSKGDEDKIASGLHTVHEEDPTFSTRFEPELGQT